MRKPGDTEQMIEESYRREIEKIHAPEELIARTKEKTAAEEERYAWEKKARRRIYGYGAAAAALLFICVCLIPLIKPGTGTKAPIYLGNHESTGENAESFEVTHAVILPVEFSQDTAWEEEISGITVKFAAGVDGTRMAAFEEEKGYVIISAKMEEEEFREAVRQRVAR